MNRGDNASRRWFRLLLRLYPVDFRDELGASFVETYCDRASAARTAGGGVGVASVWLRALVDSLANGMVERLRPAAAWRRAGRWGRDVESASRRLVRAPMFTAVVVATLTIGLGAAAVVYTAVQRVLIDPMPYPESGDLYFVWRDYGPIVDLKRGNLTGPDVAELQRAGGVIDAAAGLLRQPRTFSLREGEAPTEIAVMVTSPNVFELLGVQPAIGRGFAPGEVGPGRPPVVVLTDDLWKRLGADPALLGSHVRLNGQPFTVIGILPPGFAFVRHAGLGRTERADAYVTLDIHLAEANPRQGSYAGLIRAHRGTGPEAVASAVDAIGRAIDARDFAGAGLRLYPVNLKSDLIAGARPALLVLAAAGAFLALAVMVNLASVLLARAAAREHEYAVSRALGANSGAVVRATLIEGGLLGLAGGVAAVLVAIWGSRTLVALAPLDLPRREAIAVDWRIALAVISMSVLLGLVAAVAPAVWAARTSLSSLLAASAVRGGGGHGRMRRGMVVVQVALTLVLLSAGGLVVRSFERLLAADPGFRAEGVLTLRVPMPAAVFPEIADVRALQDRVDEALAAVPGVTGVSAASGLPLTAVASQNDIGIPGAPGNTGDPTRDTPLVDTLGVRPDYVNVMGLRLVMGRDFETVRREDVREVLIDHVLARQFFPGGNPVGATIPFNNTSLTIVGVVEQPRLYDVHQDGRPQIFLRAEDWNQYRSLSFVLRSTRDLQTIVPSVRAAVRDVDPRLAIADVRTMDEIVRDSLRQSRVSAVLVAGFAIGALLLAVMGIFGVIAGSVTRRRHELAVRLALGADHGRVLRLVLGEGVWLVGLGLLIGVPGIYAAGMFLRGTLVGISEFDPLTLTAVASGLICVAMTACYVPARRVLRIEPAQALRSE